MRQRVERSWLLQYVQIAMSLAVGILHVAVALARWDGQSYSEPMDRALMGLQDRLATAEAVMDRMDGRLGQLSRMAREDGD